MDAGLKRELEEKVRSGERLTREDGVALYASDDLAWLGGLAHEVRTRRNGDTVSFGDAGTSDDTTRCTMPYGRGEEPGDRVDHVLRLRELQDVTGSFQVFVPLRHQPDPDGPDGPGASAATGAEVLKTFAVSRLLFDNVPHVQVLGAAYGVLTAQLALQHGADDVGAGDELTREDLLDLVRDAGFRPVERNTRFEAVRAYDGPDPDRRETPQAMRV
jgi:aminodeoxyfutalosine synthase